MDTKNENNIQKNLSFLCRNTGSIIVLLIELYQSQVITEFEVQTINSKSTDFEKNVELYGTVCRKGNDAFRELLKALRLSGNEVVVQKLLGINENAVPHRATISPYYSNGNVQVGHCRTFQVSIMSKDISNGQALAYHNDSPDLNVLYKVGLFAAKAICVVDGNPNHLNEMPKRIHHTGMVVDNVFCEYTDDGIYAFNRKHIEDAKYISLCRMQVSARQIKSFINWIRSEDIQTKYSKANYDKAKHNCIHFTKNVCEVIGIPFPEELQRFMVWLKKYPTLVKAIGIRSGSTSTSEVSLKFSDDEMKTAFGVQNNCYLNWLNKQCY